MLGTQSTLFDSLNDFLNRIDDFDTELFYATKRLIDANLIPQSASESTALGDFAGLIGEITIVHTTHSKLKENIAKKVKKQVCAGSGEQ